jgi:hypothetical protein
MQQCLVTFVILISTLVVSKTCACLVTLNRVQFQGAESKNLLCNDGSPGGYYIRPALENAPQEAKNTWIFHQEGSHLCIVTKISGGFCNPSYWEVGI